MAKLYELTKNYQNIVDLIEDESVPREVIETALQAAETDIALKAESIAKLDANLAGSEKAFDTEIERLTARKKAIKNRRLELKEFLKMQLETINLKKLKSGVFTISIQNNPPALHIEDETLIPANYQTLIPEHWEIQKDLVKADLKDGKEVTGAKLTIGTSLRIR
jgi:septal ring factor EnvC (AmiA/AmiB activator)